MLQFLSATISDLDDYENELKEENKKYKMN